MKPVLTQVRQEEREDEIKPLDLRLIRRLLGSLGPHAGRRNLLVLLVVVRSIQLPLVAWSIGAVLGGPVARLDPAGILWGAAGYALLEAVTAFTFVYRARLALELGEDVIFDLRLAMFERLQAMPMRYFHTTRLGRLLSRFGSDAEAMRAGVQDVLFVSLVQGGQMLVAGALMCWYDPVLFAVTLAMWPALWAVNRRFRKRLAAAYRAVQESFSRVTATLAETVNGIRVIQGFSREEVNAGMFRELLRDHYRYNLEAAKAGGVFLPLVEFQTQVFVALTLAVGSWRVLEGQAGIEALYQFILMSGLFFGPVQALSNQYNQALTAMAGAERVYRLLDAEPGWRDPPDALAPADLRGEVVFERVGFAYEPGRPVLADVSFRAAPGMVTALVGHTGSGKSTIVNLAAKFYLADEGRVLVDGVDVRGMSTAALNRRMGIVPQQNFLFTGTVYDNVRYGRPEASRREVVDAVDRLGCLDLLEVLPEGLQTVVGEKGTGVSLGQRQLICFARAMLADPRILLLDEATASVDSITEARLQRALEALLAGRTCLVVAHRLSTIRGAHQVLVLEAGRVVERGAHGDLLALDGVYAELWRRFAGSATL